MKKHVLFVQGGGGADDHAADLKLVNSLRQEMGNSFELHYPLLENDSSPDFGRLRQIGEEISAIDSSILLIGHSLGASMLLKWLSEKSTDRKIDGLFLLATPFWNGHETWEQGLKLQNNFEDKLPKHVPTFFYHCRDDQEVPFNNFLKYGELLPWARFREFPVGGHQFDGALVPVTQDIKSIINSTV